MRSILWTVICVAVLVSGCRSVDISAKAKASVIGQPIQSVIQDQAGHKMEMFDNEGNPVQELPQQQGGSVSIYNNDQTGQDNYTFGEDGLIGRHRRSYGENYAQGIWEEVK